MAERLRPDTGTVSVPARVGLLRQEDTVVRSGPSVLQAYAAGIPGLPEDHREGSAALGLFRPRDLDRPVEDLSAGQRRRVEVARLTSGAHDRRLRERFDARHLILRGGEVVTDPVTRRGEMST